MKFNPINARSILFWLAGALLLTAIQLTLYLPSAISTPQDKIWTPVAPQGKMCSDDKYYVASTRGARQDFFHHRNPNGTETKAYWIDITKAASTRLSALLQLGLPIIWAIPVSSILLVCVSFTLLFMLAIEFEASPAVALVAPLTAILNPNIFLSLNFYGLKNLVHEPLLNFNISNFFRYVILEAAFPIFFISLLLFIRWMRPSNSRTIPILAGAMGLLVAYSYPTLFILYGTIAINGIYLLVRQRKSGIYRYLLGFIIAATLVASASHLQHLLANHHPGVSGGFQRLSRPFPTNVFIEMLFGLIVFILFKKTVPKFVSPIINGAGFTLLTLTVLLLLAHDATPYVKIYSRGPHEFFVFLWILGISKLLKNNHKVRKAVLVMVSLFGILLPTMRVAATPKDWAKKERLWINRDDFDAILFMQKMHAPLRVFAVERQDADLLSVYTNHYLIAGGADFEQNGAGKSFDQYLDLWKCVGLNTRPIIDHLHSWVSDSQACRRGQIDNTLKGEISLQLEAQVYYPYISEYAGQKVLAENGNNFSDGFINKVEEKLNASLDCKSMLRDLDIIILSSRVVVLKSSPNAVPDGFHLIFKNPQRMIYEKIQ